MTSAAVQRWSPKIALWLAGAMCCIPFLVNRHYLPIPSFFNELAALMLGLAACTLLLRKAYWQPWCFPVIAFLPVGLVLSLILQVTTGLALFAQQNLLAALYLLWACCLMMLSAALRREFELASIATVLSGFILAAAVLSALIGLQQFFQVSTAFADWLTPTQSTLYGNLAQRNHLADLLALGIASLLYLRVNRRLNVAWTSVLALLLLFAMSLIGSRSSWLYLGATAALALWGRTRDSDAHGSVIIEAWLLLPAFALLQYIVSLPWFSSYGSVLTSTERFFHEVAGVPSRLQFWQQAWEMFLQAPWLGAGFGRFAWMTFELGLDAPALASPEPTENAHNIVMNLLAEMGLPAALLLLCLVGAWVWRVARCGYSAERWWLFTIAAILGIHSMLEYPLWYAFFLGIAALVAGLGETSFLQPGLRFGRGLVVVFMLLGWIGVANVTADYTLLESWNRSDTAKMASKESLDKAKQALSAMSQESLLAPYAFLVAAISLTPDRNYLQEQLHLCEVAQRFSPVKQVVFKYALLLALAGETAKAERQLRMAMAAYPAEVDGFRTKLREWVAQGVVALQPLLKVTENSARRKT